MIDEGCQTFLLLSHSIHLGACVVLFFFRSLFIYIGASMLHLNVVGNRLFLCNSFGFQWENPKFTSWKSSFRFPSYTWTFRTCQWMRLSLFKANSFSVRSARIRTSSTHPHRASARPNSTWLNCTIAVREPKRTTTTVIVNTKRERKGKWPIRK